MRSAAWPRHSYVLVLILFCALATRCGAQINPHTQIRWPANCNTTNYMSYNYLANTCVTVGPVGTTGDVQLNQAGAWATASGFRYDFATNTLSIPNISVAGISTITISPGQVTWPPACSTGVYLPSGNTCVPPGTAANATGVLNEVQINAGGAVFGAATGVKYDGNNGLTMLGGATVGTGVTFADGQTQVNAVTSADPLLNRWQSALAKGKGTVLCIGDSTTRGTGDASLLYGWCGRVGTRLQSLWGPASAGTYGIYMVSGSNGPTTMTVTGTLTSLAGYGIPFNAPQSGGAGQTATLPAAVKSTGFDIYYLTNTDSASGFSVAIDGGGSTTYGATTTGSPTWAKQSITGLSYTTHNLVITWPSSGNAYIWAVAPTVAGTTAGGITAINTGVGGTKVTDWTAITNMGWISLLNPDLVTISFDLNDANGAVPIATYTSSYNTLVSTVRGSGASVLIVDENPGNTTTSQVAYSAANFSVAASNHLPIASVYNRWGRNYLTAQNFGYGVGDGLHPNSTGYADIAEMIYGRIVSPNSTAGKNLYSFNFDAPISTDFTGYINIALRNQFSTTNLGPGVCVFGCGLSGGAGAAFANGIGAYTPQGTNVSTQIFTGFANAIYFSRMATSSLPTSAATGWTHFAAFGYGTNKQLFSLLPTHAANQYGYMNLNGLNMFDATDLNAGVLVLDNGAGNQYGMDLGRILAFGPIPAPRYATRLFASSGGAITLDSAGAASITGQASFTRIAVFTNGFAVLGVPEIIGQTPFTTNGLTCANTYVGNGTAGTMTVVATGCTVIVNINGATGLTAPNGWTCAAHDRNTPAAQIYGESSSTTTTATFSIPASAVVGDVISWSCRAY